MLWCKNVRHWDKLLYCAPNNNKFMPDILYAKIKDKSLVDKSALSGFTKNADLNKKDTTLATKAKLKTEKDKIITLQAFDSSYFCGKSYFEDDGTQNYLVFQPVYQYFKNIGNSGHISACKPKGLSDCSFIGLFWHLLIKIRWTFTLSNGSGFGKNVIVFGGGMSSSVPVSNKQNNILIHWKGPIAGLDDTTLTAEKDSSIDLTKHNRKYFLSLHDNKAYIYDFVNDFEIHQFKGKDYNITATLLCLFKSFFL